MTGEPGRAMPAPPSRGEDILGLSPDLPDRLARGAVHRSQQAWRVLEFGAQVLVLMLAPSSYRLGQRRVVYRHLVLATVPLLPAFVAISLLLSLILVRIVLTTAATYGLSHFALSVLVRTLVIELLPLFAALFVALRYTMPQGEQVAALRSSGRLMRMWRAGGDPARDELLPRVLAGMFSVALLVGWSCVQALVVTYLMHYGFTTWGLEAYTRAFGQIFTPAFTLIFGLKTFLFSLAVAVLPMAPYARHRGEAAQRRDDIAQLGLLFAVVLCIEALALVGNYY